MRNDKFELVRYGLKRYNLIEHGPTMEDRQCEVEWDKGQCYSCMATHICTKRVKRCFCTSRFVNSSFFWLRKELRESRSLSVRPFVCLSVF